MSLLVISPDFASHYRPLAVLARSAKLDGSDVVVATGPSLRPSVEADGFVWRELRLGAGSNSGVVACDPAIRRFIAATEAGPIATLRRQALDRKRDLLYEPERVATEIAVLCAELDPEHVIVDHVSFASTLAMYATGRSFITLVPGHASQLPVGGERYGVPATWPSRLAPDPHQLAGLEVQVDRMTRAFTARWNEALDAVSPSTDPVRDAFRVHGHRVLYNSPQTLHDPARTGLPAGHRFVGPLVREEALPAEHLSWSVRRDGRAQVYVALGTFLSHRGDVLGRIADALRHVGVRAAFAVGATPVDSLGRCPDDWVIDRQLPQVAMLRSADLIIHHGGNNSVQEALAAGVRQLVLPFSTDQFVNAADLERIGAATVLAPNGSTAADIAVAVDATLASAQPQPVPTLSHRELVSMVFG